MPLKPRGPKKERPNAKKKTKTAPPLPSYLPRLAVLPGELLPLISKTNLREILSEQFNEFSNINDHLPSLKKINGSNEVQNLHSSIEQLTVSNVADNYFVEADIKFYGKDSSETLPLFVKRIHLVEPIHAMAGLYSFPVDGALPQAEKQWQRTLSKIHSEYNEAYIDTLCTATLSRLVEQEKSPHWIRLYGTFNARVQNYIYNITSEITGLRHEKWFKKNQEAGLFRIRVMGDEGPRPVIKIVENDEDPNCSLGNTPECEVLFSDDSEISVISSSSSDICKSDTPSTDDEADVSAVADPPVRIVKIDDNSTVGSGSVASDDDTSSVQQQCEYYAEFDNFPVQVLLLERCEGTMDALLDLEETTDDPEMIATKDARWSAWLVQVISALTVAQHYYGFVHNDLHTNNIMWTTTDETHLYYKLQGPNGTTYYGVPTYGRLMKIIDFGRASFWLHDRSDLLITDAFAPENDAAEQYNCPPYYDESQPRIDPNPSFDLCRLAVSMFDALYPEQPATKYPLNVISQERARITFETDSPLYNLLWRWLTDSEGKSIIRNPDDSERFPDFDLYKHIAKFADKSIPRMEIKSEYFKNLFSVDAPPAGAKVWDIPLS
jgi:hypothetical protein